ncbi:GyrI-like domain-containing protein [Nonlabens antarcticus]|uniref:GyrI-like domain-containing protein n=1 Tax=Nonlabens antarcticus TaxID=392714 RepID=UPI0018916C61|nr:GyrI-like domain-containing protein [Nonlabens antarcticus]
MKALKYILILLLVVIIAGAVYFSLQDGHYDVKRTSIVDAPSSLVYDQIADFDNWANWNTYHQRSDVDVQLNEQSAGVDANYSFTDEDGKGTMTITRLNPNKSIDLEMFYKHSLGSSRAKINYKLAQVENGTEVIIHTTGDKNLVGKILSTLSGTSMDEELGPSYEKSIANLNQYLTTEMDKYIANVDGRIDYSGGYYLYMSSSSSYENLSSLQSQMLRKIHSFMDANNIDSYGADMVLYEKFDEDGENAIFSAAVPVQERVITAANSRILVGFMEPQSAIKITLKGSYDYLREAWKNGDDYISANGLERSEQPPFEVYKTDPSKIDNPANYITEIYLPVR